MSGTSSSIKTKLWWNSQWMVLFQNCVRQLRSPAKMATTVQLCCYWKQLWSRWAITGSWEPLVLFWNDVSFVPVRVLHKDEQILGWKHIYLPYAQTAIYDSKVKLFLKQGICHQLGRDAVVRFECENSAIDVIINF